MSVDIKYIMCGDGGGSKSDGYALRVETAFEFGNRNLAVVENGGRKSCVGSSGGEDIGNIFGATCAA